MILSKENVSAVTTRGCKSTREPPFPQDAGTRRKDATACHTDTNDEAQEEAVDSNTFATQEDPVEPPRTSWDYHDTTTISFRSG